jgi:hypothetical protein
MGQHVGPLSHEAATPRKVSHGALNRPTRLGRVKTSKLKRLTRIVPLSHSIRTGHMGQQTAAAPPVSALPGVALPGVNGGEA